MGLLDNRVIIDFAAPEDVSTLTVLMDFRDFRTVGGLLFALVNAGANDCDFIIETSEDGIHVDVRNWTIRVTAGKQGSVEVQPNPLRTFWRLSSQTVSPFPITQVQWRVKADQRVGH